MIPDVSMNDKFSLRNGPRPPPPSSKSALSFSRSVIQDATMKETAKPSQSQKKWALGEDEMRSDTHSRRRRLRETKPSLADEVLLNSSAPKNSVYARVPRPETTPLASDRLSAPEIPTSVPQSILPDLLPESLSFDIHASPQDTLDVRPREHNSAETTTTWTTSVKSTISEDLSRDDKDRGAKLRYLQKRNERQTRFAHETKRYGWSEV